MKSSKTLALTGSFLLLLLSFSPLAFAYGTATVAGVMHLDITKEVSLDGVNYTPADTVGDALTVTRGSLTRVYSRVHVTNLGPVTATNIRFSHDFNDHSGSLSEQSTEVENLSGARLDTRTGEIVMDDIYVNDSQEFTYSVLVQDDGTTGSAATDEVTLNSFKGKILTVRDDLTYQGAGTTFSNTLVPGGTPIAMAPKTPVATPDVTTVTGPAVTTVSHDASALFVSARSNPTSAKPGDQVTITLTVENNSGEDMTGMVITYDYDNSALKILGTMGGTDSGSQVQWERALLRDGETQTYTLQTMVKSTALSGSAVGMTRVLLSEFDEIAPTRNTLAITGGGTLVAAANTSSPAMQLAQTGPAGILSLLMLSVLAAFGFQAYKGSQYKRVKKLALAEI